MERKILSEVNRIKEVMGLIVEATNPIFSWIDDLFYNLSVKNKSFQEELNSATEILSSLKNKNVISPSNNPNRAGKEINQDEILDTIKNNEKFKIRLDDGTIVQRNLSDLIDEESLMNVLKKYSKSNPENFRTIFREIVKTDPTYLPDGIGDTIESLVKNKSAFISRGVEGKQKYKEFLDNLDNISFGSTMDREMKDLVSDFVIDEKNSIGLAPSAEEIKNIIIKKFYLKTGKKELPKQYKLLGIELKKGISSNQIEDIVNEVSVASEIKDVKALEDLVEEKLLKLGFDENKYKVISKNLYQQNCFDYYLKGELKNPNGLKKFLNMFSKSALEPTEVKKDDSRMKTYCWLIPTILFSVTIASAFNLTLADVIAKFATGAVDSETLGIKSSAETKKLFKKYFEVQYYSVDNLLVDVTVKEVVSGTIKTITDKKDDKTAQTADLKDVNKLAIRKGDDSLVLGYDSILGASDYDKEEQWYVMINNNKVKFPNLPENFWINLSKLNVFANWLSKVNPNTKNDFTLATYSIDYKPETDEYFVWSKGNPDTASVYKGDDSDNTPGTDDDYVSKLVDEFNKWVVGNEEGMWGLPVDTNTWTIKVDNNNVIVEKTVDPTSEFYKYEYQGNGKFKLIDEKTPAQ
jgi:hypothetical protein